MPNGDQQVAEKPKSFLDIASSFPVDMSEDTYNAARAKYFQDVVIPKIKPSESIGATWTTFKSMTERPHLLTTAGRAALAAQLGATAAAREAAAPLRTIGAMSEGPNFAAYGLDKLEKQQVDLTRMGDREGLNTKLLAGAGSLAGTVIGFEAASMAVGPVAGELMGNFAHGARSLQLVTSAVKSGSTFAAYNALSATDGERMTEGLKGFAIGAGIDLALGTPGLLIKRGAAATKQAADDIVKRAATGVRPSLVADATLTEKVVQSADIARKEGRAREIKFTNGQQGARVYVTDVAGTTAPIEIKQYKESDAYQQMANIVRQGGSVSHFEVHPEDQKVLNDFLRIQGGIEEAKYRGTTVRTTPGQGAAVARAANEAGLPSEVIAPDTVYVATVTHEVPKSAPIEKPERPPVVEARKQPTTEEVEAHLDAQGIAPKDKMFVTRQIERIWDKNVPEADKRASIQIALKYAPHMLPEEYSEYTLPRIMNKQSYMFGQIDANAVSEKVSRIGTETLGYPLKVMDVVVGENPNRVKVFVQSSADESVNESVKNALQGKLGPAYDIGFSYAPQPRRFDILGARSTQPRILSDDKVQELLDFWDVKPGDVDIDKLVRMSETDATKELEAVRARVEEMQKGERIAEQRPKVTDEGKRPPFSKFIEDRTPPNELNKVSVGEDIRGAIESITGSKFLDQRLRTRPSGRTLVLSEEEMTQLGGEGMAAASHPNLKVVLSQLGIEPPVSLGDAEPVTLLREGSISPTHVYHEQLHTNMHHADAFGVLPTMMPPPVRGTALSLVRGLIPLYGVESRTYMLNEAYVHAAQAIRFGDTQYLDKMAGWDTSVEKVKEFVNATSKGLLQHSIDVAKDSIPVRNLQRSVSDLIRRTDPGIGYELKNGAHITGTGIASWYDPARGWVLKENADSERVFDTLDALWDHMHDNDKNFLSPSYSFMPEQAGIRGGMTPPGAEPNGSAPPNPEVPLGRKLAWNGISAWWRPTLPWAASLDTAVNRVLRSKGITVPIYDTMKDVDDMVRTGNNWMRKMSEDSEDILQHFDRKKLYDVAQYLTYSEKERTQGVMDKLGLSQEDALRAHQYGDFLKQFQADTGIDALGFLQRDYPRLRMHAWDPSGVWGPGISEKNAGFWEKAVRYDQGFDPRDLNLGRFNQFLLREGMQKKFTAEPLQKLNALIARKGIDGDPLLPANVRYPLQNYHNYMKNIPDNSQIAIQNGIGKFFDVLNERTAQLNENLPGNVQIPKITLPPKQLINRMMILSYAMGLGARPAIAVRDGLWSLMSSSIFLGPGRMVRALAESFKPEAWARAREAGALLQRTNIGEMYGDVLNEMPTGGKNLFDRLTKWSNMLLAPSRWAHNFGRNIMFNGEYLDALDAINEYRGSKGFKPRKLAEPGTIDTFFKHTSLPALEEPQQNRLLRFIYDPVKSPHEIAVRFGLDAVDISEWPYRRGTQPMALRFGAGRILGQYGVWPANYIDFGARIGRLAFTQRKLAARMALMWGATNFSASTAMEYIGVDSSKWFFLSPMGYAGSPQMEFVMNLAKAPEATQQGREARRAVLEYPLNFVPAMAEIEGILKNMQTPGGDAWPPNQQTFLTTLGFKPLSEHVVHRDWQAWLRYQAGFPKAKPGE
jgi:hypothetical protein